MNKFIPDRKVLAGGVVGVLTWLVVLILRQTTGLDLGPDAQSAISGVVGLIAAYVISPSQQDIVKRLTNYLVAVASADKNSPVSAEVLKAVPPAARIDAIADVKERGVNIVPTPPPRQRRDDDAL